MSNILLRKSQRSTCPRCGYPNSYSESTNFEGLRVGKCWSCLCNEFSSSNLRAFGGGNYPKTNAVAEAQKVLEALEKAQDRARVILNGADPVTSDNAAGKYLIRRGLGHLIGSEALRYRAGTTHPAGGRYPAMVALVQGTAGEPLGIHRTYLAPNGHKADVEPAKASLGPIWSGAIRLSPVAPEIVIGEGIETSASAGLLLSRPAWAAISAGNLAKGLMLPQEVRAVVIAADHDRPGLEAAETAAARWRVEGRNVRIIKPSTPGLDFNDVLRAREAEVVVQ